ncbi:uncharacterized protein LOC117646417 isoform X2 [Thrips palmi]|uniref:Uncharacterized protein LOC117646417 isoform X2 n=1 Tax=Thrips palmi TaxID=161013 RepID=A0A6P8Z8E3_THRPL|nr:uncharacterized protein LOC117646417 isoform X2 [Thrips palmi]
MDFVHRKRITGNLEQLVNETSYERLVRTIDKLDENRDVIPEALLSKWKERPNLGFTPKELCFKFYLDIQRRGPQAFQLLINCLKDSGHPDLARALDPTLSIVEEPIEVPLEYYSDEGDHYVFLNKEWRSDECNKDREALQDLFQGQGFLTYEEGKAKLEDVSSLMVIVFSLYLDGSQQMENYWLHSKFNDFDLHRKPKILISFLYSTNMGKYGRVKEETAKMVARNYEDVLHVKIYVDAKKRGSSPVVSEEVSHFISVFASDRTTHLEEKLLQLQQLYNDKGLHPITTLDSRFRKLYRIQKQS